MTWDLRDGGLANQWWQGYLEPADAAEFAGVARSTMLVAGGLPVHIRVLPRDAAGVIVLAHGLRTYGLVLAALLLRLHRRGFTVVQVDLPGFGQSGGARGQTAAAHVREAIGRAIDFAAERAQGPIHLLGLGEECLAVYEACARPGIASASLHAVYDGTDDALAGTKTGSDGAVVLAPEAAFPAAADGAARPGRGHARGEKRSRRAVAHAGGASTRHAASRGQPGSDSDHRLGAQRPPAV